MKYLAAFFGWLQQLFATSILNLIIILFLAIAMAAITHDWLTEQFYNMNVVLTSYGISEIEYWAVLIAAYALFFIAIKISETLIAIVILNKPKKE
jgi:hypothetical protein